MDLMVGCPVYRRDWILPRWFEHVEQATEEIGVTPVYAFVLDPRDETTHACVNAYTDMYERCLVVKTVTEDVRRKEGRHWTDDRIMHMVGLRNALLRTVRHYSPKHFLSLDSDILLSPHTLESLLSLSGEYDAVGGKVYLSKAGTRCPSYASLQRGRMVRQSDIEYVKSVDVIMAVKMMNPSAYNVDYEFHSSGEDIGWSAAVKRAGLTIGYDGRYPSKHVWGEEFLDVYDRRVGY